MNGTFLQCLETCQQSRNASGFVGCCVFPFVYKRKEYRTCTQLHNDRLWCSNTYDFDKDQRWGNCVQSQSKKNILSSHIIHEHFQHPNLLKNSIFITSFSPGLISLLIFLPTNYFIVGPELTPNLLSRYEKVGALRK